MSKPSFGEQLSPFHLALRVHDLDASRRFYIDLLGASVGRTDARWIDYDIGGHQVTVHLDEEMSLPEEGTNPVDGDRVPVPHFGVVLDIDTWKAMGERLKAQGASFVIAPRIRFEGETGEQGTFFLRDPSGNALEFKGFRDRGQLFAS
ncbi:MAG: VOC family protein [Planctomycetota bacterium]